MAGDTITGDGGGIVVVRNLFGLSSSFQGKYNGCDQLRLLWASLSCVLKDEGCGVEGRKHSQQ